MSGDDKFKIAITGHTSGLGKSLFEHFNNKNYHYLRGLSRTNGYDISDPSDEMIDIIKECDIFINNAYSEWAQVDLLYKIYKLYQNHDKLIINISSNSPDGIKRFIHDYAIHKTALDRASEQLTYQNDRCSVVNIRPGFIDTPMVKHIDQPKLSTNTVVDYIEKAICGWRSGVVQSSVTILPKK